MADWAAAIAAAVALDMARVRGGIVAAAVDAYARGIMAIVGLIGATSTRANVAATSRDSGGIIRASPKK